MDFWKRFERGVGRVPPGTVGMDPAEQAKVKAYELTDDSIRYYTKVLTRAYEVDRRHTRRSGPQPDNIGVTEGIGHNLVMKELHPRVVAMIRRSETERILRDLSWGEGPSMSRPTEIELRLLDKAMEERYPEPEFKLPKTWKPGDPVVLFGVNFRTALIPAFVWEEQFNIDIDDAREIGKGFIMGTLKEKDENRKKQKVQVGEEVWNGLPWHHKLVLGDMGFQIGTDGELGGMIGFQKARQAFIAGHAFLAAREMLWNKPGEPTGYAQLTEGRAYNNAHIAIFGYPWPGEWEYGDGKAKAPRELKDLFSHENLTRLHAADPKAERTAAPSPRAKAAPAPQPPQTAGAPGDVTQPSMWLGVP